MILLFLLFTALSLATRSQSNQIIVSKHLPDNTHEIILPSYSDRGNSKTYLSLNFSASNGSLYANNDIIYPPPASTNIHGIQQWKSRKNKSEMISLRYALEEVPNPTPPTGKSALCLELLGLDDSPVDRNTIAIQLHTRETLTIERVYILPIQKSMDSCLAALTKVSKTPPRPSPSRTYNRTMTAFLRQKDHHRKMALRILRGVIPFAVLGALTGLMACVVGYVLGQVIAALGVRLFRSRERHRLAGLGEDEGVACEKKGLLNAA